MQIEGRRRHDYTAAFNRGTSLYGSGWFWRRLSYNAKKDIVYHKPFYRKKAVRRMDADISMGKPRRFTVVLV